MSENETGIKYELIPLSPENSEYFMLLAKRNFGDVKAGDTGGIISKKVVLSHDGESWVYPECVVDGNVIILGDTKIIGDSYIKSSKPLNIFNTLIDDTIIKISVKMDIDYCIIVNGYIRHKKDIKSLDCDEYITAYTGINGELLMMKDGFEKPYELQVALSVINYSKRFDNILSKAINFKNRHRSLKLFKKTTKRERNKKYVY